jgi:AcrR family transcriptional regulator
MPQARYHGEMNARPLGSQPPSSTAPAAGDKPRLTADDWLNAALDEIAGHGVHALAVEPLARRLGVTKGSFYWHFENRDALLKGAIELWERQEQEMLFDVVDAIADPRERLRRLFMRVSEELRTHIIYGELLKALDHALVKPIMSRVVKRRLDFVARAFRQIGLDRQQAQHRALLCYSVYAGFLQLSLQLGMPRFNEHAEFEAFIDHTIAALIPAA